MKICKYISLKGKNCQKEGKYRGYCVTHLKKFESGNIVIIGKDLRERGILLDNKIDLFEDMKKKLNIILKGKIIKEKGRLVVMSFVCLGLSEVCEGLAKVEEHKKYSKKFLKYAIVFLNLSELFKKEIENEKTKDI